MKHLTYEVHGSGVTSLARGLSAIDMPVGRHQEAIDKVRLVLDENDATNVRWYKVPNSPEIAFQWGDDDLNKLYVGRGSLGARPGFAFPLTITQRKVNGWEGHYFNGCLPGSGGGSPRPAAAAPRRPCQKCWNYHEPGAECF